MKNQKYEVYNSLKSAFWCQSIDMRHLINKLTFSEIKQECHNYIYLLFWFNKFSIEFLSVASIMYLI